MKQDQKSRFKIKGQLGSQSGQAVVEYLLLAVVTLGLILGMRGVFKNLNDGAQKYMGDYIVCLMDYGELPSLGVASSDLNQHSSAQPGCDKKFAAFTFDQGRPPLGGGSSSSGSSSSNSANNSNSSSSSSSKNGSKNGSDSSKNSSNSQSDSDVGASDLAKGGGRNGSSGSKSNSPYRNGQVRRSGDNYGTLDGSSLGNSDRSRIISDGDDETAGGNGRNRRTGRRGRNYTMYYGENYRAITGGKAFDYYNKQLKKTQTRSPAASVKLLAKQDESYFQSNRKEITPQERIKAPEASSDDGKFTFGNIMRWLMIAGMVIAIVIFFGGQVMNYSNSSD